MAGKLQSGGGTGERFFVFLDYFENALRFLLGNKILIKFGVIQEICKAFQEAKVLSRICFRNKEHNNNMYRR